LCIICWCFGGMALIANDDVYCAGKDEREANLRKKEDALCYAEEEADELRANSMFINDDDIDECLEKARQDVYKAQQATALDCAILNRANNTKRTKTIRENLGLSWRNLQALAMGKMHGFPLSYMPDGKRMPSPLATNAPLNAKDLRPRLWLRLPKLPESAEHKRTRTDSC